MKLQIRDNLTIRDDLFSEVEACMEFIRKHTSKSFIISGKAERDEVWEYPLEAVREIVVNMIVHRDYRESSDSAIKIFDDRIEFFNPGGLPEGVSMDMILSGAIASNPRNKQIASIFKEAGIIEKYGSGIKRDLLLMKKSGAKTPLFENTADCFKVILFPVLGVSGGVSELLEFITNNPGKNAKQIHEHLNISRRTVERHLLKLKSQKKIKFIGPPKNGGYFPANS